MEEEDEGEEELEAGCAERLGDGEEEEAGGDVGEEETEGAEEEEEEEPERSQTK